MTKEEVLKQIGLNIKKIREKKNISQQVLAAMCNFEKANMSRIESGGTNVTIGTLNKIANALEIKLKEIIP